MVPPKIVLTCSKDLDQSFIQKLNFNPQIRWRWLTRGATPPLWPSSWFVPTSKESYKMACHGWNKGVQISSPGSQVLGMWFNGALSAGHMARCVSFEIFCSQQVLSGHMFSNIVQSYVLKYCLAICSQQILIKHMLSTNIVQPFVLKYCSNICSHQILFNHMFSTNIFSTNVVQSYFL